MFSMEFGSSIWLLCVVFRGESRETKNHATAAAIFPESSNIFFFFQTSPLMTTLGFVSNSCHPLVGHMFFAGSLWAWARPSSRI